MKGKILIVSLIAVFCVFMSACGCSNEEANPVKDPITHETDAGTDTTQDDKDNDKTDENKDNGNSGGSTGSGSSSSSNGGSSQKSDKGSSGANSGNAGKNTTIVTPAPTFDIPEPENTPTPPRRSSSSNLRVD